MIKYKVTFANHNETAVPKFMLETIKKEYPTIEVEPIVENQDLEEILKTMLEYGTALRRCEKEKYVDITFLRSCDTIYSRVYLPCQETPDGLVEYAIKRRGSTLESLKEYRSIPKFYEMFIASHDNFQYRELKAISISEIAKMKKVCFYNKEGIKAYMDKKGLIYACYKYELPSTRYKEEYAKFNGNTEAVKILYHEGVRATCAWFANEAEMKAFVETNNVSTFRIDKVGYTRCAPEKIKAYTRFPYCNIPQEIENKGSAETVAWQWSANNTLFNYNLALTLVKEYLRFYVENEMAKIKILAE